MKRVAQAYGTTAEIAAYEKGLAYQLVIDSETFRVHVCTGTGTTVAAALQSDLASYATATDLTTAIDSALASYAKTAELTSALTELLGDYAKTSTLAAYATTEAMTAAISDAIADALAADEDCGIYE